MYTTSREIEFRAEVNNGGYFVYGYYQFDSTFNEHFIRNNGVCFEVKPETVGQFTGVRDKTGKKVFEGDIIEQHGERTIVKYDNDSAGFNICYFILECTLFSENFKVIGNIYENQELI